MLRWVVRDKVVYIPFDSWSRGAKELGVDKVEVPIRRSGADSVGRGVARSASLWPTSAGGISLLALLRDRR
jgi:hypothetical protein